MKKRLLIQVTGIVFVIAVLLFIKGIIGQMHDVDAGTKPADMSVSEDTGAQNNGQLDNSVTDTGENVQPTYYMGPTDDEVDVRDFEAIKTRLAGYGSDMESLQGVNAYVLSNGTVISGQELFEGFYDKTTQGIPSDLDIISINESGTVKIIYLNYDGNDYYCVIDSSREVSAEDPEAYLEMTYGFMKIFDETPFVENPEEPSASGDEADSEENHTDTTSSINEGYLLIYLVDDDTLTFEDIFTYMTSGTIGDELRYYPLLSVTVTDN